MLTECEKIFYEIDLKICENIFCYPCCNKKNNILLQNH